MVDTDVAVQSPSNLVPRDAILTYRQITTLGVTRGQLRGSQYMRVMKGLYARADHPLKGTFGLQALAAVAAVEVPVVIWGTSALRLFGVELPTRLDSDRRVHLLTRRGSGRSKRPELAVHYLRDTVRVATVNWRGMTLAAPIEAWLQAALDADHDELVQMGDGLVRYKNPLTDISAIREYLKSRGSDLPTRQAAAALRDMRQGTDSITETKMRQWINAAGLPEPEVNRTIVDQQGQFLARVDLYFERYQTVAEYDGQCHATDSNRIRDNNRRRLLQRHGIEVVVATRSDLSDPTRFLESLAAALKRQAAKTPLLEPGPSLPKPATPNWLGHWPNQ